MTYVHTFLNLTLRRNKQIIDYVYLTDEIQIFDVYILQRNVYYDLYAFATDSYIYGKPHFGTTISVVSVLSKLNNNYYSSGVKQRHQDLLSVSIHAHYVVYTYVYTRTCTNTCKRLYTRFCVRAYTHWFVTCVRSVHYRRRETIARSEMHDNVKETL